MYYIFLLTSLLSVCANSFAMDKKYPLLQIKSEGFLGKSIVKNNSKKPFFLKGLSLLCLSPEAIRNSEILTRMVDDETNITNTLPFKKQDIPHILSIVHNNIDTIAEKDLERSFEIANYLDVPNYILVPLAERYVYSWGAKNEGLIKRAKKCGSLAQLTYDELADQVTITNDSLTYDVQCSINLENKALYSLHGFEKFFELIENKNVVTKISLKNNNLAFLNAKLFSKFPNLEIIDVSQNKLSAIERYKLRLLGISNIIKKSIKELLYTCTLSIGFYQAIISTKKFGSSTEYSASCIFLLEIIGTYYLAKKVLKLVALIPSTKKQKIIATPQKTIKNDL